MNVQRRYFHSRELEGAPRRNSVNRELITRLHERRRTARQNYRVQLLSCLAGSIALMLAVAHLPFGGVGDSVGWYVARPDEREHLELIGLSSPDPLPEGSPITRFEADAETPPPDEDAPAQEAREELDNRTSPTIAERTLTRMQGRRVLDAAQRMPQIVGGIGSYYIHIEYPEEAMLAGIEGRLVLSFIVETSGRTSAVEVVETLHPACDSAAVRALRKTRFVPGRQNGDIVPVRMRLPVRFKLVAPGQDAIPSDTRTASS